MAESYFSCEIFKDGCAVHGCCCSHTTVACSAGLQVPVDTTHWELQISDMHSLESCIWLEILWPNKFHIYAHFTEGYLTNGSFILGTSTSIASRANKKNRSLPEVQPFVSETLLLPWPCHCLYLPFLLPTKQYIDSDPAHTYKHIQVCTKQTSSI